MTDLMTATVTETVTASCYSPTLSECTTTTTTTTTTAASTGRKRRSPKFDMFMDLVDDVANAKVYKMPSSGEMEMVDISEIMPSPAMGARLDADMVVDAAAPNLQGGTLTWSEVAMQTSRGRSNMGCGRSGEHAEEKRARIIALQNEVVTKPLTTTETVTETDAATTVTFSVGLACTTAGFMFSIPAC